MAQRKKPNGKKYDRVKLVCTTSKCDNEFYVSDGTTPARRKCYDHFHAMVLKKGDETIVPKNNSLMLRELTLTLAEKSRLRNKSRYAPASVGA